MDIKDAYMDVGRYDYMEVIGRAKQDARAESNAGAITERPLIITHKICRYLSAGLEYSGESV